MNPHMERHPHRLDEANVTLKWGSELTPQEQRQVKRIFVHRFTIEHIPEWANRSRRPDGTAYMPQFQDDKDWLANTQFAVNLAGDFWPRHPFCYSYPTWPLGKDESK